MVKKSSSITKSNSNWLWRWAEPESELSVIPKSKTKRLAQQAKLANVDAERAVSRAYQIELSRTKAIGEAMFVKIPKSGLNTIKVPVSSQLPTSFRGLTGTPASYL